MCLDMQENFPDAKRAESNGGKTGSGMVQGPGGIKYQLKKSIEDASWVRNKKASGLDTVNFGEVIAAYVCKAIAHGREIQAGIELVPLVYLVHNKHEHNI
jgi:hypothetical protein